MSHSACIKRSRVEESNRNDFAPPSKVYIIKLVVEKSSGNHVKEESNSSDACADDNVFELQSSSGHSVQYDHAAEELTRSGAISQIKREYQSILDDDFQSKHDYFTDESESELIEFSPEVSQYSQQLGDGDDLDQSLPDDYLQSADEKYSILINTSDQNESGNTTTPSKTKKPKGWNVGRNKLRFQEKWLTEFPFIEYDVENNAMYCKACRKYVNDWRKTSPFVIGNRNFRASMLKYHQRSSMHAESQELADTVASEGSNAEKKDLYKEQLSHVFKSVYFIFKNKMPYTHYPQLCESQKREGTDFSVYSSHLKVVPLFGKFICMAFEKDLAQKISDITEFSLVIDASFRRNIESHDLVYLKYLDRFMVRTVFLGVIDSSAKLHDSIYSILCDLLKKYGINNWADKVVYIMTDKSDSHMWLAGLISLIKTLSPKKFFTAVTYLTHKIKYCANVVQSHKITSTFDALLWSIYCYYERVDKGKKNLMHMNKVLDDIIECYGNLPKNSYTTLYYEALSAIEKDYAGLVVLLESEQLLLHCDVKVRKAGAKILSVITRNSFICKLAFFSDIFSCLNDFAVKLGSEDLLPYDVHMLLEEARSDIEKASDGEGKASLEVVEELLATPSYFREIEIVDDNNFYHIVPEVKKFCQDVISYLESLTDDYSFLGKCFVFNICMWPEDETINEFGNSEFIDIYEKINGTENNVDLVLAEWKIFKSKILSIFPSEVRQNSKSIIMKIVSEHPEEFPYVTSVLQKILLLNFECSEIKRGYHEMCLNKSFSRSMLSLQSLQTSMMVSMYGPSLSEFDFSLALDLFLNSRHRKFRKKIIDRKLLF